MSMHGNIILYWQPNQNFTGFKPGKTLPNDINSPARMLCCVVTRATRFTQVFIGDRKVWIPYFLLFALYISQTHD